MKSFEIHTGKGARGRYGKRLTLTGPGAEGFARLTAAMVPSTHRAKVVEV